MHGCPLCSNQFKTTSHLKQHIEIHASLKRFQCLECQDSFRRKAELNAHVKCHKRKAGELVKTDKVQCNLCSKYFIQASQLKVHIKRHLRDKRFSCDECDAAFITKRALKLHTISHRQKDGKTDKLEKFGCKLCGMTFLLKSKSFMERQL